MSFHLDASFLVTIALEEATTPAAERWWRQHRDAEIFIGAFAAVEVASAISRGVRTRRFSEAGARIVLADFDLLRKACETFAPTLETFIRAEALVRDFNTKLAGPDALHLAGAMEAGASLVTFDERLAAAAREYGVDVVVPG